MSKKGSVVIEGEELNIIIGSKPLNDEEKEPVKAAVLALLRETENGGGKSEYNPGIYRVTDPALNIRTGPGVEYPVVGVIKDQGSYTITEIRNKSWGRLLSGAGWINCHKAYCFYGGSV